MDWTGEPGGLILAPWQRTPRPIEAGHRYERKAGPRQPTVVNRGRGRIVPRASAALTAAPRREPSPAPGVPRVNEVRARLARERTGTAAAGRDVTIADRDAMIIATTVVMTVVMTAATTAPRR